MPVTSAALHPEMLLASGGMGILGLWMLLVGSLSALAFPSLVAGDFLFTIDDGVIRLMAGALALGTTVLLADHYGLVDVTGAIGA